MAQSLSLTSFVMEHRLPWAEGSSAAPPGAGRFDGAFIIDAGQRHACTVRSVSPLGATLTGEIAAREGAELAIELVSGQRPGASSEDARCIAELEREVRELRRANEILKAASAYFARELDPRLPR